jgi:hypothetical protein
MDHKINFFPAGSPEIKPPLYFDDQPVESMIYMTEKREKPTPADDDIRGFRVGMN